MTSLCFILPGKHFLCPSIVNDSYAEESNLGCRFLPFIILNISWQSLLDCKVSFQKSADSLIGTPLWITLWISLAAFKILSLSLIVGIWICGFSEFKTGSLAGIAQWIEHGLRTKGLPVQFPVRAHAWISGQVPRGATWEATTHWCFSPSLSPSLPISENKQIRY